MPQSARGGSITKHRKRGRFFHTSQRFPERAKKEWEGPLVDYKEIELLRKFLTTSAKVMSRKRAGTSAQEQRALQVAIKRARHMALLPYTSS
ncbi:MAG: 30S ribosomal protein S18 [Phycisphaerae bacterium]